VFERTLRRVLAFQKAKNLNKIKFRKPMSGRLRKISIPTRIQEVILLRRGEWPDTSTAYGLCTYQPTIDTFDTVYSYFN
jgi:hypothetical protein